MAKAMMKRGTENNVPIRQMFCPECGEWDSVEAKWNEHSCIRIPHYNTWNISDNHENDYYAPEDDIEEVTIWSHDSCDNYFQQELEERDKGGPTWVCGSCGWESQNKERVMRCCL